ncbi:unnamed protein product [Victoria cruziana]
MASSHLPRSAILALLLSFLMQSSHPCLGGRYLSESGEEHMPTFQKIPTLPKPEFPTLPEPKFPEIPKLLEPKFPEIPQLTEGHDLQPEMKFSEIPNPFYHMTKFPGLPKPTLPELPDVHLPELPHDFSTFPQPSLPAFPTAPRKPTSP